MQLQTQTRPKVISVQVLEDRIDAATAIQFKERMRDIASTGDQRMVLDLARVQFLDSSGLGAIVVNLRCEEAGPYLADRAASAVDPTQKARLEALVKERAPSEAE